MKALSRSQLAELCECRQEELPAAPLFQIGSYTPPGPVGASYIRSLGPIDVIMGPAGSGKTIASIFKVIRFSIGAMPVCTDNVIRVRGTVLRDNFRAMYRTTIRSWFEFFPPDYHGAIFTGGQDRPAQHILKLSTVRTVGGVVREVPVELTVDFFAVADVSIEDLLKGYETSWVWCNEGDLLHERVIPFAYSRTGRYPPKQKLPPGTRLPRVVAADMNPPKPKHPLLVAAKAGTFQNLELVSPEAAAPVERAVNFFTQPSGLSKEAENRAGKSFEAYAEEARTGSDEDVRRFVHGLPGYPSDGRPIYRKEFRRADHVAAGHLVPDPRLPLHAGFDQGLKGCAIFLQEDSHGQLRVLREVPPPAEGWGFARFIEACLPLLHSDFRGCAPGVWAGDPAGFYGADTKGGERSWMEAVSIGLGRRIEPAPSQETGLRWEAVRIPLRTMIEPGRPAIIIDSRCEMLIEGFEAEYKHPKRANGSYGDEADKNLHSNIHDALQYIILTLRGADAVIHQAGRAGRPGNVVPMAGYFQGNTDFSVFS